VEDPSHSIQVELKTPGTGRDMFYGRPTTQDMSKDPSPPITCAGDVLILWTVCQDGGIFAAVGGLAPSTSLVRLASTTILLPWDVPESFDGPR
jgi:hypothetical protein